MKFLLRTFGEIALLDSDEHQIAFPKKALLIIAYLLANDNKSVSRTSMARFLWGEGDLANSLTNLRKLVSRIKSRQSDLNIELLIFDDTDVHLTDGSLASDIVPTSASTTKNPAEHLASLTERAQLKFLERANCQTRAFIDWRKGERRRHLTVLKETLDAAVKLPVASGDIALIKEAALLLFDAEPQDEATRRILLKAFDAEGGVEQLKRIFARRKDLVSPWPAALAAWPSAPTPAVPAHSTVLSEQDAATQPILRIPRLALLPPGNDSPDGAASMIASSLIEDITLGFCALHSLRVIAPYFASQISQTDDQAALSERYDINYVLETQLSGPDDDLSLFTQLISLPGSEILWAERFNFDTLDLARNKREISRQIVLAAAAEVERHEMARAYFEDNPLAYHQYLVGQQYLHRLPPPNMRRAREELKAALSESVDFALALSSVARTGS
jgi:TolB-like protein/DNA-binding SARP family transcriptional activator